MQRQDGLAQALTAQQHQEGIRIRASSSRLRKTPSLSPISFLGPAAVLPTSGAYLFVVSPSSWPQGQIAPTVQPRARVCLLSFLSTLATLRTQSMSGSSSAKSWAPPGSSHCRSLVPAPPFQRPALPDATPASYPVTDGARTPKVPNVSTVRTSRVCLNDISLPSAETNLRRGTRTVIARGLCQPLCRLCAKGVRGRFAFLLMPVFLRPQPRATRDRWARVCVRAHLFAVRSTEYGLSNGLRAV